MRCRNGRFANAVGTVSRPLVDYKQFSGKDIPQPVGKPVVIRRGRLDAEIAEWC